MKAALTLLLLVTAATPVLANSHRASRSSGQVVVASETSSINCATVRSYVTLVGLTQARALARANGMTPSQEWRARQCLANRD